MRKLMRIVLALLIVVMASSQTALADRGGRHGHGGGHVGVGVFIWPGWWWPYPYYPPPVVLERPADIYIQPQPQTETPRYWYYCRETEGYYPSVKNCPEGWLKVVPPAQPPEGEE